MNAPAAERHFKDHDHYFNGEVGDWTNCGNPWKPQPDGIVNDCTECVRLEFQRKKNPTISLGRRPRGLRQ